MRFLGKQGFILKEKNKKKKDNLFILLMLLLFYSCNMFCNRKQIKFSYTLIYGIRVHTPKLKCRPPPLKPYFQ